MQLSAWRLPSLQPMLRASFILLHYKQIKYSFVSPLQSIFMDSVHVCVYTSVCLWCGYDRTFDIFKASCPVALLRCVCFVFPADLLCIKWGFCSLMATSKNRHMKANMNMRACVCICMFSVAVLHSNTFDCFLMNIVSVFNICTPNPSFSNYEIS